MPHDTDPATSTLHAVRVLGYADTARVARRLDDDADVVREQLLDLEAIGWVGRSDFAGTSGWSLTETGRVEGERRLAAELDAVGGRAAVAAAHERFLPVNARFQEAVTRWQVRPMPGDALARNDHTDHRWDDRVLEALAGAGRRLRVVEGELVAVLDRFGGYADRYDAALRAAERGADRWVDGVGIDSCHIVWMQLHEDLVATLGITRGG